MMKSTAAEEDEEVSFDGVGDGGNQVVLPWSSSTPPPLVESSSESGDSSSSSSDVNRDDDVFDLVRVSSLKRMRENASDLRLQSYKSVFIETNARKCFRSLIAGTHFISIFFPIVLLINFCSLFM